MKRAIRLLPVVFVFALVFLCRPLPTKALGITEMVVNGGFESYPIGIGWYDSSSSIGVWTQTHSGSHSALMGSYSSTEVVGQDIDLPSYPIRIELSYYFKMFSSEILKNYDYFGLSVFDSTNSSIHYCSQFFDPGVATYSSWQHMTCDLTAARGHSISVVFGVGNDSSYLTSAYVDDVSILAYPDQTAPSTTLTTNPSVPNGSNGWFVQMPQVTLSASDEAGGSGLADTGYDIDGAGATSYSGSFVIPAGVHSIHYVSWDNAGNWEAIKTANIKVDLDNPTISASLATTPNGTNGWFRSAPTAALSGTDGTSGLAGYQYSADGGSWQNYGTGLMTPNGTHAVSLRSYDYAGRVSDQVGVVFKVDTELPTITPTIPSSSFTVNNSAYNVSGTAGDSVSGLVSVSVNGTPVSLSGNAFSLPLTLTIGNNTVTIQAVDNAGNITSSSFTVIYKHPSVLGVSTAAPVVTNGKSVNGGFKIPVNGHNVVVKPFANYKGAVYAKHLQFGDQDTYIFIPLDPYSKGAIYVYNGQAKLTQTFKPFGSYVKSGMTADLAVEPNTDLVYLIIGQKGTGKFAQILKVKGGVSNVATVRATSKSGTVIVRMLDLYSGQLGAVTMLSGNTKTVRVWKQQGSTFVQDKAFKTSTLKLTKTSIRLH